MVLAARNPPLTRISTPKTGNRTAKSQWPAADSCSLTRPNGPRYVEEMSDDERRDFANLVLLCLGHHNTVDGRDWRKYSIVLLEKWKSDRETQFLAGLKELRDLTEDRLQEMISGALESQLKRLDEAISRLGQLDPSAASILRGLAVGLDPDTIDVLHLTASQLRPVLNPDTVEELHLAATALRPVLNLETVDGLSNVAGQLNQSASGLNDSAEMLLELISSLTAKIDELRRLQDEI